MRKSILQSKLGIIILLVLMAAICLGIVSFNAYSAKLQYEINKINSQTTENQLKIANLQVKIQTALNVTNLESRALEMGLIYPDFGNMVILENSQTDTVDLAMALKQNAYQ